MRVSEKKWEVERVCEETSMFLLSNQKFKGQVKEVERAKR